ncbi:MAG: response regulator transcription factor [Myxococcota bacterium]
MSPGASDLLIVEDDEALAQLLSEYFQSNGFSTEVVARGDLAVERILGAAPRLVILDLMLPGIDGFEVCRRVRPQFRGGILMLTARKGDVDEVLGLEFGADDYVTKPAYPRVLLARVRSLLRRLEEKREEPSLQRRAGALLLDRGRREASIAAVALKLTALEFDLLWRLAESPGEVVERERLYREVLETEWDGLDRGVDIHISRVRQKLVAAGLEPSVIKSVRGTGYLLVSL